MTQTRTSNLNSPYRLAIHVNLMKVFNESEWKNRISDPLWYKGVSAEIKQLLELRQSNPDLYEKEKERIYAFFETQLADGAIALGDKEGNFDTERKAIDTIVIHHTHGKPGMTKERLSAMQLLRLYAPYYEKPTYPNDHGIVDQPISSGHVRDGKQVFYPYHLLVRNNGFVERLLEDSETGWHSGDWEINCRSIAITIDDDVENATPSLTVIKAIARIIILQYPEVPRDRIFGHCEIKPAETCPSRFFLPSETSPGWKKTLLDLL